MSWTLRRELGLCALVLCGLASTSGCKDHSADATGKPSSGPTIVFITNSNADWWSAVEKGMKDGGKDFKVAVEMRRNEGSAQGQIEKLKSVLSMPSVKGVAISVIEANAGGVAEVMKELKKAGKLVITIDSDGDPDSRIAYIGTNNIEAGKIAGKVAAAVRPQGGPVVVFVGSKEAANSIERRKGFFEGAGSAFSELETFTDGSDKPRAAENVRSAISKYTDMGMMLGIWSYNAPAIAQEMESNAELRKRVNVVTFDLDERAVLQMEQGLIDATVCQNPYEIGYKGVELLKALIDDDKTKVESMLPEGKTVINTGIRVIIPKADPKFKFDEVLTIEEMKKWLSSKGLKSS